MYSLAASHHSHGSAAEGTARCLTSVTTWPESETLVLPPQALEDNAPGLTVTLRPATVSKHARVMMIVGSKALSPRPNPPTFARWPPGESQDHAGRRPASRVLGWS